MDPQDRKMFIKMFFEAYIHKYMNTNLHCHFEFFQTLKTMYAKKKESDIMDAYQHMKYILQHNDFIIPTIPEIPDDREAIKRMSFATSETYDILLPLKDKVDAEVFALLSYVYHCVLKQKNVDSVLLSIKYLTNLKYNSGICILDVLFSILLHIAKLMGKDMYKYTLISWELLHLKNTKKDMSARIRILYITVYVMLTQCLDTRKVRKPLVKPEWEYLYVLCEKDMDAIRQLRAYKNSVQFRPVDVKQIYTEQPDKPNTSIVKISQ